MDSLLVNALIGGFFTFLGIVIKHFLDKRSEIKSDSNVENRDAAEYESKNIWEKLFNSDVKRGLSVLALNFIFIAIVVGIFDLNNTQPAWEDFFAMVVIGAVPVYGIFCILKGFFKYFVD